MLKQLIFIAPLLVQAAFAAPGVEPRNLEARHQHLHGHIEHTHGEKQGKKTTTSVRREPEQTVAPQFINPKMPYALKPHTKARKTTTAADSDDPKETVVPEFIPPKMPFVPKSSRSKTTNEDSSVQVESLKKKTVAKVQDDDDNDTPTFIQPKAPFRGPSKPQQTQATADVPRDTLPAFIPPKSPWGTSKHNTRSTDTDDQDASEETAIPDPQQRAYNDQDDNEDEPAFSSSPELLKRDETDGDNEFFEEEDSEYNPSDFPNLDQDESGNGSDEESQDTPANNETDQSHDDEQPANDQDDGPYQNRFGGDFDEEDDANDTPTRLEARGAGKRNILYFTNWGIYGANFQPQDIPAKEITHVLYSFALVNPDDGTVYGSDRNADTDMLYPSDAGGGGNNVYGCVKQLYLLKKKNRNLKVLLSIGGWGGSPNLASGVSTQARRQRFISTAVKLITDWGFDGIDIDWEYPKNSREARNYVLILANLRKALDQYSKTNKLNYHFLLTVATSAGANNYNIMDMKGMDPWLDGWHLMAYDYAGPWDTTTGHQSNVYLSTSNPVSTKFSTHQAISDYIAAGVPARKILMGMALYGRSFLNTDGLGKSYSGIGGDNKEGTFLLKVLPRPGATQYFDSNVMATYTYDSKKRELVTFDNIASGKAKAGYISQNGLGGAFYWEASGDKSGSSSVVAGVRRAMGTVEKINNLLSYPTSKYDNLRAGMP
ncbi:hypothetical protein FSARC_7691 [Fusarium sarcochroum]|uniref:chitinase n=1 Tax=Fusarium sarcochroum TaxID=1208366 RepID=A0A8H4X811_9HYPO|nr:hypothetical protein FSARC_7691 [Fusarium sarcochroum]